MEVKYFLENVFSVIKVAIALFGLYLVYVLFGKFMKTNKVKVKIDKLKFSWNTPKGKNKKPKYSNKDLDKQIDKLR